MSELTTYIIGHGEHRAVRADELQPGDVIVWNGPTTARVYSTAPVPSKSGLFLTLTTVTRDGDVYQRRVRRDRAVAFDRVGPVPLLSGDLPDQHRVGTHKLYVREVCQHCKTPFPEKLHRSPGTPTGFCCDFCAIDPLAEIEAETTAAVEADREARAAYQEKHRLADLKIFLLEHQTHGGMGPSLLTALTRSRLHQQEDTSEAFDGGRDDLDKLADALLAYFDERTC